MNLQFLSILLEREGYNIQCATNGETALRSAQTVPPDLILLDITMPEMDGYEVCRRLKANSTTAEIPVIFVSAIDASLTRDQVFAVGGMDYVAKPYRIQDLLSSVQKALEKSPLLSV
ncbi:MAG: response regulator [Leptolyngbyaceae cyanobacterium SM1_3_5]|nr:response regulator [Leptolyngbyaceae cyanobacterium SM1_3_5]